MSDNNILSGSGSGGSLIVQNPPPIIIFPKKKSLQQQYLEYLSYINLTRKKKFCIYCNQIILYFVLKQNKNITNIKADNKLLYNLENIINSTMYTYEVFDVRLLESEIYPIIKFYYECLYDAIYFDNYFNFTYGNEYFIKVINLLKSKMKNIIL